MELKPGYEYCVFVPLLQQNYMNSMTEGEHISNARYEFEWIAISLWSTFNA